ncbi:PAS domain-containing protein [Algoriphagus namhaensis]
MATQPIELILARQFGDTLSQAFFLVDPQGNLLYYNEKAEMILGVRFGETGAMSQEEWSKMFLPKDVEGKLLTAEDLPLVQTLRNHKPAHGSFYINSATGESHLINVTSIPVEGRPKRFLGAIALFWNSVQ